MNVPHDVTSAVSRRAVGGAGLARCHIRHAGIHPVKREDIGLTSRSVVPTPQVDIFNTLNTNPVLTEGMVY
jgi:hypothetical protein